MRRMLWTLGGGYLALALSLAQPAPAAAQEPDAETKAKLEALKKQVESLQKKIDALHEQEKTILKEVEKRAEEKDYFTKLQADIKGRLQKTKNGWAVAVKGTLWHLDLGDKKEWIELAKKLEGKTVMVTGSATIASTTAYHALTYPGASGFPGPTGGLPMGPMPMGYGGPGMGYGGPGMGSLGGGGYFPPTTTFTLKVEKFAAP
jgi:hypothetical protein